MGEGSEADTREELAQTLTDPEEDAGLGDVPRAPGRLSPGELFQGLEIHSLLGRGAMGEAYLASHPILKTPLVVKSYRPLDGDVFREAHLAARIASPYVVGVVDAGMVEGHPYIVQRYVDGVDFGELLRRLRDMGRALPPALVAHHVVQLARGLHEVHQAGVVHRDLKPRNLFLNGEGEALAGDFGIAVDPASSARDRLAGTPPFVAPEIWAGGAPDARSDVYALGATAHLLATGEYAFDGPTPVVVNRHLHEPYEAPTTEDPAAAFLFAAIAQMLRKTPDHRPPHMEAVARMLIPIADAGPAWRIVDAYRAEVGGVEVLLRVGELEESSADVVVSATNAGLEMGRGVSAALRRTGGEALARAAAAHAPAKMGEVVWTAAGELRARWVAHAVAAHAGAICLQRCAMRILLEAMARGARHVAFPSLGTGVAAVPQPLAAKLMLESVATIVRMGRGSLERIDFVLHKDASREAWSGVLAGM